MANKEKKAQKKAKKLEIKEAKRAAKKKATGILSDFKAFISRGNVVDMAVGVVIGGAFSAIVTAVVNILLSICMWGVPGGLSGLVTVLPAVPGKPEQAGMVIDGLARQSFETSKFAEYAKFVGEQAGATDAVTYGTNILNANYTKFGGQYVCNSAAVINWGAVINAIISFLIVAIVLFIIIKVIAYFNKVKAEIDAKAKEAYYQKHPEERPVVLPPEAPKPTTEELLTQIRDLLAANATNKTE